MSIQGISGASASTREQPAVSLPATAEPAAPAVPGPQAQATPKHQPDQEQIKAAVEQIQKSVSATAANLNFSIDKDTGKTVVKVVDAQTGDLIRQIPSEEVMAMAKSIDKMQGLLLQRKA